jgi:hypothetical protein
MEWLKKAKKLADNKPIKELTSEEYGLVVAYLLLEDAEQCESLTLRDYCYLHSITPSELLRLVKPYLPEVEQRLKELGFIKASKYGWRKFKEIPWERIEELSKKCNLDLESAYVLYVAWRLLKITMPLLKDWKGYNIVHAFAIHDRLNQSQLSNFDIDWINERLVNYYKDQIQELGLDYERLKKRLERVN